MNTVEGEREAAKRESSEVLHQQEEDADQEIEEMRDRSAVGFWQRSS